MNLVILNTSFISRCKIFTTLDLSYFLDKNMMTHFSRNYTRYSRTLNILKICLKTLFEVLRYKMKISKNSSSKINKGKFSLYWLFDFMQKQKLKPKILIHFKQLDEYWYFIYSGKCQIYVVNPATMK